MFSNVFKKSVLCIVGFNNSYSINKLAIFALLMFISIDNYASGECGDVWNPGTVGPWDYADPFNHSPQSVPGSDRFTSRVNMVETPHFPPSVERLQKAKVGGIMGSLSYTLSVFPNHTRALWALVRYEKKLGKLPPMKDGSIRTATAECYIIKALTFRPQDMKVRQIYGSYMHMNQRYEKALEQYKMVEAAEGLSGELAYNMGLTYYELNDYKNAKEYAEKAIKKGFALPGLKRKLVKIDKW